MKLRGIALAFIGITSLALTSQAQLNRQLRTENQDPATDTYEWPGVAAGLKLGTLGPGAELTIGVMPEYVNVRLNLNYLKYSYDREISDINYEVDLDFTSLLFMLDWHPFANNFRITVGGIRNNSESTISGTPTEDVEIGDNTYPAAAVGTVSGNLEFQDLAPYIGLGFGDAVDKDVDISFIFDLGVIIQTLDVTLTASGPAEYWPGFQEDLKKQESEIQGDLDGFQIYPVLAFGIAYYF